MAEALDTLNCIRFFREIVIGRNTMTTRIDQDLELTNTPETVLAMDCVGLFDAVNRNQSTGLGLTEKQTPIETLSIRQICSLSKGRSTGSTQIAN
eukprot:4753624-Lingulodinium_polyedra.AAC.1